MKKIIKEAEIAEFIGKTYNAVFAKSKANPEEYELLRLGAICKKYNIKEEDLEIIISEKSLNSLKTDKEKLELIQKVLNS